MNNELLERLGQFSQLSDDEDSLLQSAVPCNSDDNDDRNCGNKSSIFVTSIRDANFLLQMHMNPSGAQYRKDLVNFITDPKNRVLSECDVYHNFIMDLFRTGDADLALKVCDFVLKLAPYSRDILGNAIKACGDSSQFERGEEYLERALEIPFRLWSYRLFLYSVDFLKTKLNAYPMDEDLYHRALNLADEYIKNLPYDEHGYNQKAELLIMMNERDKAISELRKYIFEVQPDANNRNSELVTAQCCVTLLNILDDSNDYDFIIRICDRGLRNTTQEQPSASIGFFEYRKALALDGKAHLDLEKESSVQEALKVYQVAYDLNQDQDFAHTIEQRYAVLRPYVRADDFHPLVKRELYTRESNGSNTSKDTLTL